METKTEKFGIFPTCLNCYNNGYLVGYWYKFDHKENIEDLEKAMSIPIIHTKTNSKEFVDIFSLSVHKTSLSIKVYIININK